MKRLIVALLVILATGFLTLCSHMDTVMKVVDQTTTPANVPANASVNGKYYTLLQVVRCPNDAGQYGQFYDYGAWSGSSWCNQTVQSGYWVWVNPNWYIWQNQR
ncbi:MAG TPA: hypothetical protein PKM65_05065 [Spirochaetota bacterium]|nr:hypothetical protein [Spirochaetota bacterium]HNT10278.1 hypothetical protein [Spirochaetota bacterium]HOS41444.1 hypothetical protein [Spirochaetota bacterium]